MCATRLSNHWPYCLSILYGAQWRGWICILSGIIKRMLVHKIRGLIYESKTGGKGKEANRNHCSHQYDNTVGSANLASWGGENFLTHRDGSANLLLSFKNGNHFIQELCEYSELKPKRLMRMWKQNRSCSVPLTTETPLVPVLIKDNYPRLLLWLCSGLALTLPAHYSCRGGSVSPHSAPENISSAPSFCKLSESLTEQDLIKTSKGSWPFCSR